MGLPLETDVQPFAGGFALIYIITNITEIKFSRSAVLLLIFSIFAISWTIFIEGSGLLIIKTLAYPYGLIIYVFIYNTLDLVVVKSVIRYATIYFSVIVFQLMFPALYVQIFSVLLRAINVEEIGGVRGISALTTEPSFTAFILFSFLIIFNYSYVFKSEFKKIPYSVGLLIGIFYTKATSGIALIFALFSVEILKKISVKKAIVILIFIMMVIISIDYFNLEKYRAFNFFIKAASSPELILYEGSLFVRVYSLSAGFVALWYNPFGAELGSYSFASLKTMTNAIYYGYTFPDAFITVGPGLGMPSTLGVGLLRFGVFYLIFYILMFLPIFLKTHTPLIVKILIFGFTAQSYSFAFPILWFLIVMTEKNFWYARNNGNKGVLK